MAPSSNSSAAERDGIAVYRGQAYLLRNGRAALISRALVPEGQLLTWEGRLLALPSGFSVYDNIAAERDGFMVFKGQTFWLHQGHAALLNNSVVPEGQVLTASGQLVPLPADFSGFVHDRTPGGSIEPLTSDLGTQALPNQAGVPQLNQDISLRPSGENILPAVGTNPAGTGLNGTVANPDGGTEAVSSPSGGGTSLKVAGSNAEGAITSADNIIPAQGFRPVGGVSPVSGVRTTPGTTAAHITNGATRTMGMAPGSTRAKVVAGGLRDNGTKAATVDARTILDAPATPPERGTVTTTGGATSASGGATGSGGTDSGR